MTDDGRGGEATASVGDERREVLIVGGGVAGLTAGLYAARAGLDTLIVNHGESTLRRNAHLENFPGFPAGVNPRLFADMLSTQATRSGCDLVRGRVASLRLAGDADENGDDSDGNGGEENDDGDGDEGDDSGVFVASVESVAAERAVKRETDAGEIRVEAETVGADGDRGERTIVTERVIAASWSDPTYLDALGVETRDAGSKQFVRTRDAGRTNVPGVYAAGRLAERYHQAIVAAGHGAQVAITAIHDSERPFYNDWVAPEGYFTDRGIEVPPGCEEIDETERRARERESMAAMREYFAEPHSDPQRTHPSLGDGADWSD